ncbi:Glutathione-binding protein GsiB precursor [Nocardioides dokdonensis FR1436]|uniref:Glutathione-binding protein GsiB n=1 Tax=Nocardioides dokdonensis FR1436 TaxID=1300347 RepID=A0A1A9GJX2_9ACTN|nr:ABC transporter substrate-binding protein [Nocardioides dokdonensis]ANH38589.1 Glutathione-binding protein GsiB precursor [Nocardioides dokdonensis FR1436]
MSPHLRRLRLGSLALVGALAVSGCTSSAEEEGSSDNTSGGQPKSEIYTTGMVGVADGDTEPVEGGTLTVAEYSEIRTLDPTKSYANGAAGGSAMGAIYDTLVRYDHESQTFEPQLAESLTTDDNIVWTLALRDGVEFADGTPLDAQSVVDSMKYYTDNFAYQALTLMANLKSSKVVDDRTVEFTLQREWATFPNMLAGGPGMILAPAAYDDVFDFEPIGAGPFELETYAEGEELVLSARQDYWGEGPYLDELRFVWLGGDDAKLESLTSGGVDTAFMRGPGPVEQAIDEEFAGMMFATGLGTQIWINSREGRPGEDPRVRRAVALAIDPEVYLQRVTDGAGVPTKEIFPDASPWSTGVPPLETDPDAARALLEEAKADGFDGTVRYLHGADGPGTAGGVAVKAMLEDVGFTVENEALRSVSDQIQRLYIDHDYDLAVAALSIPDEDPYSRLIGALQSSSRQNTSGFSNFEMDALLADLQAAATPEEGIGTMTKIERLWHEKVPGVGLAAGGTFQAWNDNVHGMEPTSETMFLYDRAWVD